MRYLLGLSNAVSRITFQNRIQYSIGFDAMIRNARNFAAMVFIYEFRFLCEDRPERNRNLFFRDLSAEHHGLLGGKSADFQQSNSLPTSNDSGKLVDHRDEHALRRRDNYSSSCTTTTFRPNFQLNPPRSRPVGSNPPNVR